ncbi:hypothetical protein MAR_035142 [Mya arenaria]|uniref:Uncharacterized protein n=1 Tax=Mya arenaria TaxID=6604 RepID=A0ABY7EMN5_MYAAR|nr:hypothetical protein MAR_035142 [Mya arenaria]
MDVFMNTLPTELTAKANVPRCGYDIPNKKIYTKIESDCPQNKAVSAMARKKGKSKMSNAERVARWRQRQREDPSKHEAYKRKERERYEQKKKRGVVKPIAELSKRDQRSKRKQWRQSSNKYYIRKQRILTAIENTETPPHSPENNQVQAARRMGRKKVRRDRSKAYREIFKLRIALKKEERLKEKYKKRFQRQKNSKEDKRQKEEEAVIKGHNIRKAVLLYSVIVNRLRKRYKMTKTHTEKIYSKII